MLLFVAPFLRWALKSNTPCKILAVPSSFASRGADGNFSLYEDAGDGYAYVKNEHSVIPIRWEDRSGTLTIGTREGSLPGMVEHRRSRAVLVSSGQGNGPEITASANAEIQYNGKEVQTTIR
jgi:alpha-D-xyloside xylohydrolase